MPRGRTVTVVTRRYDGELGGPAPDELVVEEPLEIRLDDVLVATTMRTPGHDFELAAGFLHGDGLLGGAAIDTIRYGDTGPAVDAGGDVVSVSTGGRAPTPEPRLGATSSSCGLCGSPTLLGDLLGRLAPLPDPVPFDLDVLASVPDRVRAEQELFALTGAVHAAVAVDRRGRPVVAREDIGRHNAVDKVVGRLLLDGALPARELALFVSGRASFEMVQKAWAAGFSAVVAVAGRVRRSTPRCTSRPRPSP